MASYPAVPLVFVFKNANGTTVSYKRHEELGNGGFAIAYRVSDVNTGQDYAMKVISKDKYTKPKSLEKLKSEISIQASLNHPNILRSYAHYEDFKYYYILLELAPGKSVRDMVRAQRRLPEKKVAQFTKDILRGVGYLHDNRIIHRDLKLENYLIGADGKIKVADFGLSAKLDYDDEKKFTVCGTPNYLCPEILRSKGHSYEVDIWAIGVSVYVMLFGRQPFDCIKTKLLYEHIKSGNYTFPLEPKVSKAATDFIKSTLQVNPALRPSVQQLLSHPFITGNGFDNILKNPLHNVEPAHIAPKHIPIVPKPEEPVIAHKHFAPIPKYQDLIRKPLEKKEENEIIQEIENRPVRVGEETTVPKYFVARFCDDSKANGLGYLLADGTVGLIMNDKSRWVMDPHETFIQYYRDYHVEEPENVEVYSTKYHQVTIIKKFSKSLKKLTSMFTLPSEPYSRFLPLRHVKYWLRTENATLFRMDQKDVQVNFDDKVKIAYFPRQKKMMMVTNLKERTRAIMTDSLKSSRVPSEEKTRYEKVRELLFMLSQQHV